MAVTSEEIDLIVASQRAYADDAVREALQAANRASGYFDPYLFSTTLSYQNNTPVVPGAVAAPPAFSGVYDAPSNTATLDDLASLYVPTLPDVGTSPDRLDTSLLFDQVEPVYDINPFDESVPVVDTDLDLPPTPLLLIPDTPDISDVTLPTAPDITIPDFVPVDTNATDPGVVGDVVAKAEQIYNDSLPVMKDFLDGVVDGWMNTYGPEYPAAIAKLEAKIAAGIDGGTAMSDAIEGQIFDRARDKVNEEQERATSDLLDGMSKRGYQLPPSAVSAGLNQIQQAASKNVAAAAAETAIARAKLEQEHAQFIMTLSSTLHLGLINTAIQYSQQLVAINGQALTYSQQISNTMVAEYNLRLERYKAELQLAGIQTEIYETQLKAALADITIFEAEIRVAELQKNIEKIDVEVYQALIKAEATKIDSYVAQLQGVTTQANLEKLKVEIYGEQVRAYVAQVGAKKAEFDVYTSAIGGDEARVRAYATEVQAYSQEVNAAKAIADVEIAHSRAIADNNKNIIDEYRAELSGYVAEIEAAKITFGAQAQAYGANIDAYKAEQTAYIETLTAAYKHSALDLDAAKASLSADTQVELGTRQIAQQGIAAGGSVSASVANAMSSLAGSAISGSTTIVTASTEAVG
jgi:hypothetical protein